MSRRNLLFLVLAAAVAFLTVEGTRRRVDSAQPYLRRMIDPDDRKPEWYNPRPAAQPEQ